MEAVCGVGLQVAMRVFGQQFGGDRRVFLDTTKSGLSD